MISVKLNNIILILRDIKTNNKLNYIKNVNASTPSSVRHRFRPKCQRKPNQSKNKKFRRKRLQRVNSFLKNLIFFFRIESLINKVIKDDKTNSNFLKITFSLIVLRL